jgi:hypothetical protein
MLFGDGSWITDFRLASGGVPVEASLTGVSCGSDAPLVYRFNADGSSYQGRGRDGFGNLPCGNLKAGDAVVVFHLAGEPSVNLPGNPWERLVAQSAGILMAAFLVPLVLLFLFFITLRVFGSSPSR